MEINRSIFVGRCGTYVFVPMFQNEAWEEENRQCIISNDKIDYKVDLDQTLKPPLVMTAAQWLQQNSAMINYGRTFPYISCVHNLSNPDEYIGEDPEYVSLTYPQLRIAIQQAIKRAGFDFDFDDPKSNYEKFIELTFDGLGKIKFEIKNAFLADANYYSIALFKSMLVAAGQPQTDFVFDFCYGIGEHSQTIFLRLNGEKGYAFYNFSHYP